MIWSIDRTLSGATTPGQSRPGSDGNERVLCIPQISSFTGSSPSDCLMIYPGHSLGKSYPSAEIQLVYSSAPADWAIMLTSIFLYLNFECFLTATHFDHYLEEQHILFVCHASLGISLFTIFSDQSLKQYLFVMTSWPSPIFFLSTYIYQLHISFHRVGCGNWIWWH